jgi:hypothetical protein
VWTRELDSELPGHSYDYVPATTCLRRSLVQRARRDHLRRDRIPYIGPRHMGDGQLHLIEDRGWRAMRLSARSPSGRPSVTCPIAPAARNWIAFALFNFGIGSGWSPAPKPSEPQRQLLRGGRAALQAPRRMGSPPGPSRVVSLGRKKKPRERTLPPLMRRLFGPRAGVMFVRSR